MGLIPFLSPISIVYRNASPCCPNCCYCYPTDLCPTQRIPSRRGSSLDGATCSSSPLRLSLRHRLLRCLRQEARRKGILRLLNSGRFWNREPYLLLSKAY